MEVEPLVAEQDSDMVFLTLKESNEMLVPIKAESSVDISDELQAGLGRRSSRTSNHLRGQGIREESVSRSFPETYDGSACCDDTREVNATVSQRSRSQLHPLKRKRVEANPGKTNAL